VGDIVLLGLRDYQVRTDNCFLCASSQLSAVNTLRLVTSVLLDASH
jgi:hypothetical protein